MPRRLRSPNARLSVEVLENRYLLDVAKAVPLHWINTAARAGQRSAPASTVLWQPPSGPAAPEDGTTVPNILVNDPAEDGTSPRDTQSETSLVLGANNAVIVAYNDSFLAADSPPQYSSYSFSTDGGVTFLDGGRLPIDPKGDHGDPSVARDNLTGRIYMSMLPHFNRNSLHIFRSDTNGATFTPPVNGAPGQPGANFDKEWLTVDNFSGPGRGNVYLILRDFGATSGMYVYRSTNGGDTWGPNGGLLLASSGTQGGWITVGPDHVVYAFYWQATNPERIIMRKSTDQGVSFGAPVVVATLRTTGANGDLGLGGFRSNAFAQVVINPVNGNLYATFNDRGVRSGDRGDIFFTQSSNGGTTWSTPVKVNDDTTDRDQWQPTLAVTPNGSKVGIFWYDRRNDPANRLIDRYGVIGTVSGSTVSFGANFRITDVAFPPVFGVDPVIRPEYMGDYDQAVATNGHFYLTWGDNRLPARGRAGNNADVRFAKIAIDVAGPSILGYTPAGDTFGNVSSVRVTFDEAIDPSTFTPAKIPSFVGPSGPPIPITGVVPVAGSANRQFDILFAAQRTLGTYTMVIGPDIRDVAGHPMDQNDNGLPGETPGDQLVARFTIHGPKIIAGTPADNRFGPVSTVRVTFNEPMDPATFTNASIASFTRTVGTAQTNLLTSLTGVTPVAGSGNTQFDIAFAAQTATGVYTMVVGPDIRDLAGHRMDQNGNFIEGEIPGDQFTVRFGLLGPRIITPSARGNQFAPIGVLRVTFNEPMDAVTFTPAKIASFTGPHGPLRVDDVVPVAGSNDTQFDIRFDPLVATGPYRIVIGPDIRDRFGNPMDQNGNLIPGEIPDDQYTATFGIFGPRVVSQTPSGNLLGQVGTVRVTFNEAIDVTTFTPDKIASFTGPAGSIPVTGVFAVGGTSNTQFDITCAPQTQTGRYLMIVGPDIRDLFGNPMDQNENLIPGEPGLPPAGDQYQAVFGIQGPQILRHSINSSLPGQVLSLRVVFNEAMAAATFTPDKVASFTGPDGVKLAVTDVAPVPFTGNTQFDIFFDALVTSGSYTMVVGPDIRDLFGNPMDQNGNLIPGEIPEDQYRATFAVQSPRIIASSPSGVNPGPVDTVEVVFNEPIDPATFTLAQIVSFVGPGGPISVTDVSAVPDTDNTAFDITFGAQSAFGNYVLVLGADIQDVYGNPTGQESTVRFALRDTIFMLVVGSSSTGWNDGTFVITQISLAQFATQSLSSFDALLVDSSNGSSSILSGRASDIAAFVNSGGGLVTDNVDDYRWVPNASSLSFVRGFCGDDVRLTTLGQAHPLATGLTDPGLSNWGCSWHTYFSSTAGMDVLATSSDATRSLILAGSFGLGRLVYLGLDPTFHQPTGQTRQLIRQAGHWVVSGTPSAAGPTSGQKPHAAPLSRSTKAVLLFAALASRSSTSGISSFVAVASPARTAFDPDREAKRRNVATIDDIFAVAVRNDELSAFASATSVEDRLALTADGMEWAIN